MAIGAFVGLVGFSRAFEHEWLRMYSSSGTDIAVIQGTLLKTSVDESAEAKLKTLPMVEQVTPAIFNLMDLTPEINALVFGWRAGSYEIPSLQVLSGRLFRDGQPEVILGDFLANNLNKKPGDTMDISGSSFTVVGIYHGGSALEADAVVMPLDQLQKISGLVGKVSTFHIKLRPAPAGESPDDYMKRAEAQIEAALPGLRAMPAAERASNNQFVRLAHASAWGTSSIALLVERTREIGILRALGWRQWQVLTLIQVEAGVLGTAGGVVGIGLGWCFLHILSILPQTASIVSASFPVPLLAEALGISILAGLVAGAFPAWRGAQLSPVEALRHD
jgi:putative ABC transport system permease protein